MKTPDEYKEAIEKAFSGEDGKKLKCKVYDVFVVPNYQLFFEGSIDSSFGRVHKLEWTQHQYRFEAVSCSSLFPHGVKFTYRKFSSDRFVLIEKKAPLLCRNPIGRKTGKILSFFFFI